jgi:hypothetical protein
MHWARKLHVSSLDTGVTIDREFPGNLFHKKQAASSPEKIRQNVKQNKNVFCREGEILRRRKTLPHECITGPRNGE